MSVKDGGPAYPARRLDDDPLHKGAKTITAWAGMSLRDYFAAQALMGMHARDAYDLGQDTPGKRAVLAYIDADAMLAERAKR